MKKKKDAENERDEKKIVIQERQIDRFCIVACRSKKLTHQSAMSLLTEKLMDFKREINLKKVANLMGQNKILNQNEIWSKHIGLK